MPGVERQQAPPWALDHPGLAGQGPRIRPGEALDGCLGDRAHDEVMDDAPAQPELGRA